MHIITTTKQEQLALKLGNIYYNLLKYKKQTTTQNHTHKIFVSIVFIVLMMLDRFMPPTMPKTRTYFKDASSRKLKSCFYFDKHLIQKYSVSNIFFLL